MAGDPLARQLGHAMGHHASLATSRSGKDQKRPLEVGGCFKLPGVRSSRSEFTNGPPWFYGVQNI